MEIFATPKGLTTEMEGIEAQLKTLNQKPAEERIKSPQDKESDLEKAFEGKKVMVLKRREELKLWSSLSKRRRRGWSRFRRS